MAGAKGKQTALRFLQRFSTAEIISALAAALETPGMLSPTLHHSLAQMWRQEALPLLHTDESVAWDERVARQKGPKKY